MKTRTAAPREVIAEMARVLAPRPPKPTKSQPRSELDAPLRQLVEILGRHRRYSGLGIYIAAGDKLVCQAYRGASPASSLPSCKFGEGEMGAGAQAGFSKIISRSSAESRRGGSSETSWEMVVPIKMGSRVLGVIDAHSAGSGGFRYQDKVLLRKASTLLARFLTSRGKVLVRKLREREGLYGFGVSAEKVAEAVASQQRGYRPRSERATSTRKAAAGETPRA